MGVLVPAGVNKRHMMVCSNSARTTGGRKAADSSIVLTKNKKGFD
jgi:hypothetical protein